MWTKTKRWLWDSSIGGILLAGAAGLVAGSVLEALFRPGSPGPAALDADFLAALAGNLLPALVGVLVVARRHARPRAAAWSAGLAVPAGALLAAWAGPWTGHERVSVVAVTLGLLALGRHRPLPPPPGRAAGLVAAAGLLAAVLLLARVGATDPADRFRPRPLPPGPSGPAAAGPNVLLVSIDSLRADDAFDPDLPLETLAALRRRGAWSRRCRSPAPRAVPGHFALLTGRSPAAPACRDPGDDFVPPPEVPSLAGILRAAGWRTAAVLWNSLPGAEDALARGFELWHNPARRDTRLTLAERYGRGSWLGALLPAGSGRRLLLGILGRRIRGFRGDVRRLLLGESPGAVSARLARHYFRELAAGDRPWFLFLHFPDLHQPYLPDPEVRGLLTGRRRLPPPYEALDPAAPGITEAIAADLAAGRPGAREAAAFLHRLYQEELVYVDRRLGEVLGDLAGLGRPTLVVVTSEHGEQFGEHGRMGHGDSLAEPLLRVPLLLSGPGIPAGELDGDPVLEDVLPTVLARCSVAAPPGLEGCDLLAGPPPATRLWLARRPGELAVYQGSWKLLCRVADPEGGGLRPRALYRLDRDPGEGEDLLAEQPELAARLLAAAGARVAGRAFTRDGDGGPGHGGGD